MIHSLYFTVLNKYASTSDVPSVIEELIRENDSNQKEYDYWYHFGFDYVGILKVGSGKEQSKDILSYYKDILAKDPVGDAKKNIYVIRILEFVFSEKYPRILQGALDFAEYFLAIKEERSLEVTLDVALAPLEYFANHISQYDEKKIAEISFSSGNGADNIYFPITSRGIFTIGIINPWPGGISAEMEVVERIKKAAADTGIGCIVLDDFGCVLDENQTRTNRYIEPSELDFAITTHYESHKAIDTFYYHTLWNPPEIPLNLDYYYDRVTDNYLMNDDYLIYDSGGMTNHLRSMLYRKKRDISNASILTASCPESFMLEPNLENPIMFYCGMNWEKLVHNSNRHEGLFKLLDETGKVNFYGPEKVEAWGGLKPWEGYSCYKGSIPFDGYSILKEVNRCGVCLVLSSDIHRRAGAATNRVYEACTAGAVIISDDNEFMQKWFADAALFIVYNKNNPKDTFQQIMEKYEWIVNHKEEALELAKRAQKIFRENFALDKQLYNLVNNHASRFQSVKNDLFAIDDMQLVMVTYVVTTVDVEEASLMLRQVVNNVEHQYYRNISLAIACDNRIAGEVSQFLNVITEKAQIYPMPIFDSKGSQKMTTGECIHQLWKVADADYVINTVADEEWFYDHITTLVRTLEDEKTVAACSGRLVIDSEGIRRVERFKPITNDTVYHMQCPDWLPTPGQVLFDKKVTALIPEYMFSCLDGYEHYMAVAFFKLKEKEKISFSKRMTFAYKMKREDEQCKILEGAFQIQFIRDLLQEEVLADGSVSGGANVNKREVNDMLAKMPLKLWLKIRVYNRKIRHANPDTKRGKKIIEKYNTLMDKFINI